MPATTRARARAAVPPKERSKLASGGSASADLNKERPYYRRYRDALQQELDTVRKQLQVFQCERDVLEQAIQALEHNALHEPESLEQNAKQSYVERFGDRSSTLPLPTLPHHGQSASSIPPVSSRPKTRKVFKHGQQNTQGRGTRIVKSPNNTPPPSPDAPSTFSSVNTPTGVSRDGTPISLHDAERMDNSSPRSRPGSDDIPATPDALDASLIQATETERKSSVSGSEVDTSLSEQADDGQPTLPVDTTQDVHPTSSSMLALGEVMSLTSQQSPQYHRAQAFVRDTSEISREIDMINTQPKSSSPLTPPGMHCSAKALAMTPRQPSIDIHPGLLQDAGSSETPCVVDTAGAPVASTEAADDVVEGSLTADLDPDDRIDDQKGVLSTQDVPILGDGPIAEKRREILQVIDERGLFIDIDSCKQILNKMCHVNTLQCLYEHLCSLPTVKEGGELLEEFLQNNADPGSFWWNGFARSGYTSNKARFLWLDIQFLKRKSFMHYAILAKMFTKEPPSKQELARSSATDKSTANTMQGLDRCARMNISSMVILAHSGITIPHVERWSKNYFDLMLKVVDQPEWQNSSVDCSLLGFERAYWKLSDPTKHETHQLGDGLDGFDSKLWNPPQNSSPQGLYKSPQPTTTPTQTPPDRAGVGVSTPQIKAEPSNGIWDPFTTPYTGQKRKRSSAGAQAAKRVCESGDLDYSDRLRSMLHSPPSDMVRSETPMLQITHAYVIDPSACTSPVSAHRGTIHSSDAGERSTPPTSDVEQTCSNNGSNPAATKICADSAYADQACSTSPKSLQSCLHSLPELLLPRDDDSQLASTAVNRDDVGSEGDRSPCPDPSLMRKRGRGTSVDCNNSRKRPRIFAEDDIASSNETPSVRSTPPRLDTADDTQDLLAVSTTPQSSPPPDVLAKYRSEMKREDPETVKADPSTTYADGFSPSSLSLSRDAAHEKEALSPPLDIAAREHSQNMATEMNGRKRKRSSPAGPEFPRKRFTDARGDPDDSQDEKPLFSLSLPPMNRKAEPPSGIPPAANPENTADDDASLGGFPPAQQRQSPPGGGLEYNIGATIEDVLQTGIFNEWEDASPLLKCEDWTNSDMFGLEDLFDDYAFGQSGDALSSATQGQDIFASSMPNLTSSSDVSEHAPPFGHTWSAGDWDLDGSFFP